MHASAGADSICQWMLGRELQCRADRDRGAIAAASRRHALDGDDPVIGADPGDEQGRGNVCHMEARNLGKAIAEINELAADLLPSGVLKAKTPIVWGGTDACGDGLVIDQELSDGQIGYVAPWSFGEVVAASGQHEAGNDGNKDALIHG